MFNDFFLTNKEKEIIDLISRGYIHKKRLADKLCVSEHTVLTHLNHIYEKLDIHSFAELVFFTLKERENEQRHKEFSGVLPE